MYLLWLLLVSCTIHCSNTSREICDNHSNGCVYNLSFLAFVPCINQSDAQTSDCDVLIYPAMLQAVEDINSIRGISRNGEHEALNLTVDLTHIATRVSQWMCGCMQLLACVTVIDYDVTRYRMKYYYLFIQLSTKLNTEHFSTHHLIDKKIFFGLFFLLFFTTLDGIILCIL